MCVGSVGGEVGGLLRAVLDSRGADDQGPSCFSDLSVSDLQLEVHIIRLREELDREREERSYFQLERDKIRTFWEISKRNLEEVQAELRNRSREKEEAEERHRVEITVSCSPGASL